MMDTAKLLAELERSEAICAAATDGPWFSYSTVNGPTVQVAAGFIMIAPWHFRGGSYEKVNNCAFAAHARTELPARNQQLREALARIAELESVVVPLERLLEADRVVSIDFDDGDFWVSGRLASAAGGTEYYARTLAEALAAVVKAMGDAT